MSSQWRLTDVQGLVRGVPDTSLGDARIRNKLLGARVEAPVSFGLEGITFVIDGSAEAAVEAFNDPSDTDDAGVAGTNAGAKDPSELSPVLALGEESWLKYVVRARAKAKAGVRAPYLSVDASGEISVLVADYRVHPLSENARAAVLRDCQALRVPFVIEQVKSLGRNDALTFQTRARLGLSATLRWSDVFGAHLGVLANLLPRGALMEVALTSGASITGSLEVTDEFVLVFSRETQGKILVTVQKGRARAEKASAELGVSVGAKSAESWDATLKAVLDAVVGRPGVRRFELLLQELARQSLSSEDREVLARILHRLGLLDLLTDAAGLKDRWERVKRAFEEELALLAESKISAGFDYEYSRLGERSVLVQFEVADEHLNSVHESLLSGRLSNALLHPKVRLRHYFLRDTTTISRAWGFSLGFDKWVLSGTDREKLRSVIERSTPEPNGPRRMAYLGVRAYEGKLFGTTGRWSVDFRSDMKEFRKEPTAADFRFGLYLVLERRGNASDASLFEAVDEAIVWRVIDDADKKDVADAIAAAARDGTFATRLELRITDDIFRLVLPLLAQGDTMVAARALARALPWNETAARSNPDFRELVYAPVWNTYLVEKARDWDPASAAKRTALHLRSNSTAKGRDGATVYWEEQQGIYSFADVLEANSQSGDALARYGGTLYKWEGAVEGARILQRAIVQRESPDRIATAFWKLEDLWSLSFHLRAFGVLLLRLCEAAGVEHAVERSFSVETHGERAARELVFVSSRAR